MPFFRCHVLYFSLFCFYRIFIGNYRKLLKLLLDSKYIYMTKLNQ